MEYKKHPQSAISVCLRSVIRKLRIQPTAGLRLYPEVPKVFRKRVEGPHPKSVHWLWQRGVTAGEKLAVACGVQSQNLKQELLLLATKVLGKHLALVVVIILVQFHFPSQGRELPTELNRAHWIIVLFILSLNHFPRVLQGKTEKVLVTINSQA